MGASCTLQGLVKYYGGKRVVDNISLEIEAGEFLVILGPSGCGKTTTLRMVAGLGTPNEGVISIAGHTVSDPARNVFVRTEQRDLGMVFQSYAIWPHMTVFENIAFPLRARKLSRGQDLRRKVEAVLEIVGLEGLADRSSSALSGGQMQRVVLARAIVYNPQILLFDEPLSNLDLKMRERLRTELKALQIRTGLTCIYVTHDQTEAVELADRIAVMDGGRIVQLGSAMDIYRRPASRFVAEFISSANIFSAKVVALAGPSLAKVATSAGREFLATIEAPSAIGDTVDVVIHPEECTIEDEATSTAENEVPVRVLGHRFQGVSVRYTVEWGKEPFDVVALGAAPPRAVGSSVWLRVAATLARVLPPRELEPA